ncbi:hypothetical protein B0O80DRAFT_453474 [Mortierella sp. GBAus27b]|nr:hypothetical protein B0O80DRAFT_453474 [Mortierella sp. GBAus27b]
MATVFIGVAIYIAASLVANFTASTKKSFGVVEEKLATQEQRLIKIEKKLDLIMEHLGIVSDVEPTVEQAGESEPSDPSHEKRVGEGQDCHIRVADQSSMEEKC